MTGKAFPTGYEMTSMSKEGHVSIVGSKLEKGIEAEGNSECSPFLGGFRTVAELVFGVIMFGGLDFETILFEPCDEQLGRNKIVRRRRDINRIGCNAISSAVIGLQL